MEWKPSSVVSCFDNEMNRVSSIVSSCFVTHRTLALKWNRQPAVTCRSLLNCANNNYDTTPLIGRDKPLQMFTETSRAFGDISGISEIYPRDLYISGIWEIFLEISPKCSRKHQRHSGISRGYEKYSPRFPRIYIRFLVSFASNPEPIPISRTCFVHTSLGWYRVVPDSTPGQRILWFSEYTTRRVIPRGLEHCQ